MDGFGHDLGSTLLGNGTDLGNCPDNDPIGVRYVGNLGEFWKDCGDGHTTVGQSVDGQKSVMTNSDVRKSGMMRSGISNE